MAKVFKQFRSLADVIEAEKAAVAKTVLLKDVNQHVFDCRSTSTTDRLGALELIEQETDGMEHRPPFVDLDLGGMEGRTLITGRKLTAKSSGVENPTIDVLEMPFHYEELDAESKAWVFMWSTYKNGLGKTSYRKPATFADLKLAMKTLRDAGVNDDASLIQSLKSNWSVMSIKRAITYADKVQWDRLVGDERQSLAGYKGLSETKKQSEAERRAGLLFDKGTEKFNKFVLAILAPRTGGPRGRKIRAQHDRTRVAGTVKALASEGQSNLDLYLEFADSGLDTKTFKRTRGEKALDEAEYVKRLRLVADTRDEIVATADDIIRRALNVMNLPSDVLEKKYDARKIKKLVQTIRKQKLTVAASTVSNN